MLRPDFGKWGQSAEKMLRLSTEAQHLFGTHQANAMQWAKRIKRQSMTVQRWVRRDNARGMAAVEYEHTDGPTPFFAQPSSPKSLRS